MNSDLEVNKEFIIVHPGIDMSLVPAEGFEENKEHLFLKEKCKDRFCPFYNIKYMSALQYATIIPTFMENLTLHMRRLNWLIFI